MTYRVNPTIDEFQDQILILSLRCAEYAQHIAELEQELKQRPPAPAGTETEGLTKPSQ